ncbi:MAG: alpha/beta hydrolase-fold protein [Spirosomataceae bacterium]
MSKVYDNLSVPSKILKSDRKFAIYLPPNYETSQRSYPVLYLLHGVATTKQVGCNLVKYSILPIKRSVKAKLLP